MQKRITVLEKDQIPRELLFYPERGLAPVDRETGRPIELHCYDEEKLLCIELTWKEHRSVKTYDRYHGTFDEDNIKAKMEYYKRNQDKVDMEQKISNAIYDKNKLVDIIIELSKYKFPGFKSYKPASEEQISVLENKLVFKLPQDFKDFLGITNGAVINACEYFGIYNKNHGNDIYYNYLIESKEVQNAVHPQYLPVYLDGEGNCYCIDLKSISGDGTSCNIIFWQHDYLYFENEQPDIASNSFIEFLEKLLIDLSEHYNYDGSEK